MGPVEGGSSRAMASKAPLEAPLCLPFYLGLTWVPGAATAWLICPFRIIRASSWGSGRFTNTLPPSFLVGWTLSLLFPATNSYNSEPLPPPPIIINENPERIRDWPEVTQHKLESRLGLRLPRGPSA